MRIWCASFYAPSYLRPKDAHLMRIFRCASWLLGKEQKKEQKWLKEILLKNLNCSALVLLQQATRGTYLSKIKFSFHYGSFVSVFSSVVPNSWKSFGAKKSPPSPLTNILWPFLFKRAWHAKEWFFFKNFLWINEKTRYFCPPPSNGPAHYSYKIQDKMTHKPG